MFTLGDALRNLAELSRREAAAMMENSRWGDVAFQALFPHMESQKLLLSQIARKELTMHRLRSMMTRVASAAVLLAVAGGAPAFGERPAFRMPGKMGHGPSQRAAAQAPRQDYRIEAIPLPPNAISSYAFGVNNRGTVSGQLLYPGDKQSSFVFSRGKIEVIDNESALITSVASISDSEDILYGNWGGIERHYAGTYNRKTGVFQAFAEVPGKPISIGVQGNNAGVVLGYSCEGTVFEPVGCVWWLHRKGEYEFLNLPPLEGIELRSINDRGQISGQYLLAPPFDYRSFVLEKGVIQDLPIVQDSSPFGINNQGQILLNYEVSPTEFFRPGLYDRGTIMNLPEVPNTVATNWNCLNERGDIAGGVFADFFSPPMAYVAYRK